MTPLLWLALTIIGYLIGMFVASMKFTQRRLRAARGVWSDDDHLAFSIFWPPILLVWTGARVLGVIKRFARGAR